MPRLGVACLRCASSCPFGFDRACVASGTSTLAALAGSMASVGSAAASCCLEKRLRRFIAASDVTTAEERRASVPIFIHFLDQSSSFSHPLKEPSLVCRFILSHGCRYLVKQMLVVSARCFQTMGRRREFDNRRAARNGRHGCCHLLLKKSEGEQRREMRADR